MISVEKKTIIGGTFLFFAALFWGSAFLAQKICEDYPFSTNALRFLLGAFFMIPVVIIVEKKELKNGTRKARIYVIKKRSIKGAVICGITLAFASTFQQLGLSFGTSAGKSGFLTAIYMVLIPVFSIFLGKKIGLNVWISVILAFLGVFLMSFNNDLSVCLGDVLTLICAVCFAVNVLCVDKYNGKVDGAFFSFFQLLSAGVICLVAMIIANLTKYEVLTLEAFKFIILPVLYIAIFSCCVAYTFQVVGQKYSPPAPAAVIMSLESVFALVFSLTLGGPLGRAFNVDVSESMSVRVGIGIAIVFIAVLLAQFNPFKEKKGKTEKQE